MLRSSALSLKREKRTKSGFGMRPKSRVIYGQRRAQPIVRVRGQSVVRIRVQPGCSL